MPASRRDAAVAAPTVIFRGDLATVPLAEIFQFLAHTGLAGCLTLQDGLEGWRHRIHVRDGSIVRADSSDPSLRLGVILVGRGLVAAADRDAALRQDGHRLGEALVAAGWIEGTLLERMLNVQAREIVYGAFGWEEGSYWFTKEEPEGCSGLGISLEHAAIEGLRRVDEMRMMASAPKPGLDAMAWPARDGTLGSGASWRSLMATDSFEIQKALFQKRPLDERLPS